MAPLANLLAVAALLAAPALASASAAAASPKIVARQYQDPNSELVINNPACDFYQCTIYWEPGTQVAVNWVNPPSSGDVQVDLMTNNNSDVAYTIGTAPSISNTCDAGAGFGQPGPNGAQCGGFVFTVPSSWNAGNYSAVRAMSVQNQNLQSYTDKVYITHNSTTSNNVALSIVSGSTIGGGSSTSAAASSTGAAGAGATTRSSAGAGPTSTVASASRSSGTASRTSSGSGASSTGSPSSNGALAGVGASTAAYTLAAAFVVGLCTLL